MNGLPAIVLLASVTYCSYAAILPAKFDATVPVPTDNCGLISNPLKIAELKARQTRWAKVKASDLNCELCLDFVEIAKTYEECDEEAIEHKMIAGCHDKFKDPLEAFICSLVCYEIGEDIVKETDKQDPVATCSKLFGCKYD
ncbi:unnamed protein product, partial [Mesorhabditis spiculigera]